MKNSRSGNYGIEINSGSLNADAVAVGHGATATASHVSQTTGANLEQLRQYMADLQTIVKERSAELPNHTDLVADAVMAQTESQRPTPRISVVLDIVKRIAGAAQTVAPVVELANKITSLITAS